MKTYATRPQKYYKINTFTGIHRNNRPEVICRKAVLKIFRKLTRKH